MALTESGGFEVVSCRRVVHIEVATAAAATKLGRLDILAAVAALALPKVDVLALRASPIAVDTYRGKTFDVSLGARLEGTRTSGLCTEWVVLTAVPHQGGLRESSGHTFDGHAATVHARSRSTGPG